MSVQHFCFNMFKSQYCRNEHYFYRMVSKFVSSNPFRIFYIVFAYVIAFSVWWAYLLYDKNEVAYREKVELSQLQYRQQNPGADYTSTPEYNKVHTKYLRQKFMIVAEGMVFIVLLFAGLMRVRRVFIRELALVMQQQNFILSITHELKSPLSAIKLALQTLGKRKLEPEKAERLIGNALVDLDRLDALVDNILFAAKIESDQFGFANDEVNVSELVKQTADRFAANKKNIGIEAFIAPEVYMQADSTGFISIVTNLIENAIKYSPEQSTVKITLRENEQQIELTVADQGFGISDADKPRVFEKFYRTGNENTRQTKGTGLGLYIVKRVVEIYKGSIQVSDNAPAGTVFKVVFPK